MQLEHCLSTKCEFAEAAFNRRRSDSEETTCSVSISCLNYPVLLSSGKMIRAELI